MLNLKTDKMTTLEAKKLTKEQVYKLLKSKGHTDWSANDIAEAHDKGQDFSFLF
jgi:hypothetical protein